MTQRVLLKNTFVAWLPMAVVIVLLSGLVYIAVQQNYRLSADDPQVQIAEDISDAITQGKVTPDAIVPASPSSAMAPSLATFVTMYDDFGKPIGSSVSLDGKLPVLPAGVFDVAKRQGENRFSWQPKADVRIAAVLIHFSGKTPGFVLAGRSLREIEIREKNLLLMCGAAALVTLLLSFVCLMYAIKELFKHLAHYEHHAETVVEHHHEHHVS